MADPLTPEQDEKRWGVWINETHLLFYGTAATASYWITRRQMWELSGQLTVLDVGAFGDNVLLGPLTRDDADFARSHLIEQGAPQAGVKVKRHRAAINKAQREKAKSDV